jgi:hypothetical protein
MFWAIGDNAYLSSNLGCAENKRYITIEELFSFSHADVTCENALNEKIITTSSLPDYKKYSRNVIDENATSVMDDKRSSDLATSSFNPLYLVIILIACCYIFLIRKRKLKFRWIGIILFLGT